MYFLLKMAIFQCHLSFQVRLLLLMEEILHHQGCIKPCKYLDKLPINWCRISSVKGISISFGRNLLSLSLHASLSLSLRNFWGTAGLRANAPQPPCSIVLPQVVLDWMRYIWDMIFPKNLAISDNCIMIHVHKKQQNNTWNKEDNIIHRWFSCLAFFFVRCVERWEGILLALTGGGGEPGVWSLTGPSNRPKIVISQKSLFLNNPLRPAISWSLVESLRVVFFIHCSVGLWSKKRPKINGQLGVISSYRWSSNWWRPLVGIEAVEQQVVDPNDMAIYGYHPLNDLPIRPAISWRETWHWGAHAGCLVPGSAKSGFSSFHQFFFRSNTTDQMIWPSSVSSQNSAPDGSIGDPIWFADCWVGHLYNLLSFGHVLFTPSFQNCLAHVVSQKNPTYPRNMFFHPSNYVCKAFCREWNPNNARDLFGEPISFLTWKTCDSKAIGPMYGICPYIYHKIHQYHPNASKYASWQFHESYGKWLKW